MKREIEFFLSSNGSEPGRIHSRKTNSAADPQAIQAAALAGTMQQLIDDLPEQIALLDECLDIVAVNRAWRQAVEGQRCFGATPGHNYRDFCAERSMEGYRPASQALVALDDIASGKRSFCQFTYNGQDRWDGRDFEICFHRLALGNRPLILVTRFDLTEIAQLRRIKDELSHSVMESQALERQRMARELHDSTSQLLAGIGLLLGRLKLDLPSEDCLNIVEEMQELVRETQQGIRSISYLAHPPSLEKLGFAGALTSLVEGFARRTGLRASLDVQGGDLPVSDAAEVALYRVAQEALSNIQRHAHANGIRVLLCFRNSAVHLVIADDGIGISDQTIRGEGRAGVGLASMRSRLSEIGGRLTFFRPSGGTVIVASVRKEKSRTLLKKSRLVASEARPISNGLAKV